MPCTAVKSPPWLMTRTWSVPSTQAIFISPSPTSSTPRRSMRLIAARPWGGEPAVWGAGRPGASDVVEASGGGHAGHAVGAGGPLGLEQLAEAGLGRGERDARHD